MSSILRSFYIYLSSFSICGLFSTKFLPAILLSFLRLKISFFSCDISLLTAIFYSITSFSLRCFFTDYKSLISLWAFSMIFLLLAISHFMSSYLVEVGLLVEWVEFDLNYRFFFDKWTSIIYWNFLIILNNFSCSLNSSFSFIFSY